MRAILINPFTTSVTEVNVTKNFDSWYKILSFNDFRVRIVQPVRYDKNHSLWVDEEGLLKPANLSFELFSIYPDPLFGCGLIVGESRDGSSRPCSLLLTEVQALIRFGRYMTAAE